MKTPLDPEFLDFARQLRKNQTDAEKLLWSLFRSRQLLGLKFRRQHSIGPYILDFYCHDYNLCIELDSCDLPCRDPNATLDLGSKR
jgi:very-short-patch-repair endonuclease